MNNKDFAITQEESTNPFALKITWLSTAMPESNDAVVVRNQITKSGTSVCANYREANKSRSRADFNNRVKTCESEASEAQYWLELIRAANWLSEERVASVNYDCAKPLAIFTSIGRKKR